MIARLLLAFLALVFLLAIARLLWLRWGPSAAPGSPARPSPVQTLAAVAIAGVILLVVLAVATGRLHWLVTVPAALILFGLRLLRFMPVVQLLRSLGLRAGPAAMGTGPSAAGGRSRVETRWLRMTLDHGSGELDGEVLEGAFAGRRLTELDAAQLRTLLAACRAADPEAARLLETFLDRREGPGWRATDEGAAGAEGETAGDGGRMSRAEALDVLGLEGEPDRDAVIHAHRRLMQQFHPDRGGSDYLASLLNRARDRLLEGASGEHS
ncbi:MAG TPA: molecular chaperone DnaJ [Pseudomonadales bacterium]|nr:molecular chaperone DnaJ [Pseudomonadales bacterium]